MLQSSAFDQQYLYSKFMWKQFRYTAFVHWFCILVYIHYKNKNRINKKYVVSCLSEDVFISDEQKSSKDRAIVLNVKGCTFFSHYL